MDHVPNNVGMKKTRKFSALKLKRGNGYSNEDDKDNNENDNSNDNNNNDNDIHANDHDNHRNNDIDDLKDTSE